LTWLAPTSNRNNHFDLASSYK